MAATAKHTASRSPAPKRTKRGPTIKQIRAAYNRFNREWAEDILAHPEKWEPYMIATARSVLMRLERENDSNSNRPRPR